MTLEYRKDKQFAQEVTCSIQGVPRDKLSFAFGPCGDDVMPPTTDDVLKRMVDDGFEQMGQFIGKADINKTWLSANWSKMRLLRQIKEGNETHLFLSDTNYLMTPFQKLSENWEALGSKAKMLFLGFYAVDFEQQRSVVSTLQKGVGGITYLCNVNVRPAAVLNKHGAKLLLSLWERAPLFLFEEVITLATDKDLKDCYMYCSDDVIDDANMELGYSFALSDKDDFSKRFQYKKNA